MSRITDLEAKVRELYAMEDPDRADWADWVFRNHVFVVGDFASELAKRYDANEELARAAGLLHDVADAVMKREDSRHEQASLDMAREMLRESGFSDDEIIVIVDDAIQFHSCHGDKKPRSLEGKILATADSMAHLKTDFYVFAIRNLSADKSLEEVKLWALSKLDRDYYDKVLFDDVREELTDDYNTLKAFFSR